MNVLAFDIGNSRTKIGLFSGRKLLRTSSIANVPPPQDQYFWRHLQDTIGKPTSRRGSIDGVVISSVVPALASRIARLVRWRLNLQSLVITTSFDVGLRINYANPRTLGVDRMCGAVAAFDRFGGPVIVIDLGTAITYNVVTKDGTFLGGAIAPGVDSAASQLLQRTAQLPRAELRFPRNVIGRKTDENIQSGIMYGTVDAIHGMIKRIKKVTGRNTRIVLTGGGARLITKRLDVATVIIPSLVLYGAQRIFERTLRTKRSRKKETG